MNGKDLSRWETEVDMLAHSDATMLKHLREPKAKKRTLPFGCGSTFMSLLFTAAMIALIPSIIGQVESANATEVRHIERASDRKMIEAQIENEDPFCLLIGFPPEYSDFTPELKEQMSWISDVAKHRIQKGRTVLFEGGWEVLAT